MEFAQTLFFFLITLGVLVSIHELGHYVVARASGVHIIRFAIGFGPRLAGFVDRRGTDFALCAVPLGGYVRMLDEREPGVVSRADQVSFNRLTPWWRIAIALGGPLANFLLALVLYWGLFVAGTEQPVPLLAPPEAGTPAQLAGLPANAEIVAVDGVATRTWQDVAMGLAARLGETGSIEIDARVGGSLPNRYVLAITDWQKGAPDPDVMRSLGILPLMPALIASVEADSAAASAGLKAGDLLISVDGTRIEDWSQWVTIVRGSAQVTLTIGFRRDNQTLETALTPRAEKDEQGMVYGLAGVRLDPAGEVPMRHVAYGPIDAISKSLERLVRDAVMPFQIIGKMFAGLVSTQTLSGPITIAQVATQSAIAGATSFITILALLSVNLGVINLLPIPVLDGGHILYCLAELVRGRPLSERLQIMGLQVGMLIVTGLMCLAFYNDILRLF